jgi:uncharacterized protein (DUF433 family)
MVAAPILHINLDERGIAYIAGTSMKVSDIVIDSITWGLSPQQIQESYPHLSLAQIHAALTYYYDHKPEMDALLDQWDQEYEQMRAQDSDPLTRSMLAERLRQRQQGEHPE